MFIEGFFNTGTGTQVSDTVTVELRNSLSPFAVMDQAKAIVDPNGNAQLKFLNAPDGNYYFAVKHRNSIETWNSAPIAFSNSVPVNYNLSSSVSQAYGSNMKQLSSLVPKYAIYSGDENQNGVVNLTDVVNVSNAVSSFKTGYVPADMNGDNVVDLSDLVITSNNASAFVSAVTP